MGGNFLLGSAVRELGVDVLVLLMYAPTQSAYNIIEHARSHVSRLFAGLYLPPHLQGEEVSPCMQSSLSDEGKTAKEAALFDFNLDILQKILNGKVYNGQQIKATAQKCQEPTGKFRDFAMVHDILTKKSATWIRNASVSQVGTPEQQAIAKEFVMTVMHMDRRANFGMLCKCEVESCSYCTAHPVQSTTKDILYQFLETHDHFFLPNTRP